MQNWALLYTEMCHVSKTSRPLEVSIKEHKYNPSLLEKSKVAKHEGYQICWKEARIEQTEPNTYKESAHTSLLSQHSSVISHLNSCYQWGKL